MPTTAKPRLEALVLALKGVGVVVDGEFDGVARNLASGIPTTVPVLACGPRRLGEDGGGVARARRRRGCGGAAVVRRSEAEGAAPPLDADGGCWELDLLLQARWERVFCLGRRGCCWPWACLVLRRRCLVGGFLVRGRRSTAVATAQKVRVARVKLKVKVKVSRARRLVKGVDGASCVLVPICSWSHCFWAQKIGAGGSRDSRARETATSSKAISTSHRPPSHFGSHRKQKRQRQTSKGYKSARSCFDYAASLFRKPFWSYVPQDPTTLRISGPRNLIQFRIHQSTSLFL